MDSMTSEATDALAAFLRFMRAQRSEMERRFGPDYHNPHFAVQLIMIARLLCDFDAGKEVIAKSLVQEVAPTWTSEATALRRLKVLQERGWIELRRNNHDGRAYRVVPTKVLIELMNGWTQILTTTDGRLARHRGKIHAV
jgi:hypothetical protein